MRRGLGFGHGGLVFSAGGLVFSAGGSVFEPFKHNAVEGGNEYRYINIDTIRKINPVTLMQWDQRSPICELPELFLVYNELDRRCYYETVRF